MVQKTVTIKNEKGFHIRPVGDFVKKIVGTKSNVDFEHGSKKVNAKSVMGLMSLGVKKGSEITIIVNGSDENEVLKVLVDFVEEGFGEL